MMNIYIANLKEYNEGYLTGKWVELPTTKAHITSVLVGIGCGYMDHEDSFCLQYDYAIHDYECDIDGIEISEYANPYKLNELAELIEALASYEMDAFKTFMEIEGGDAREILTSKSWEDRHFVHIGDTCNVERDAAYAIIDEVYGGIENLPADQLENHFDMEYFGRELQWDLDQITEDMDEDDHAELEAMSNEDFAQWYIDGIGNISELGRTTLETYFDYASYGSELMFEYDYCTETGYIMSNY